MLLLALDCLNFVISTRLLLLTLMNTIRHNNKYSYTGASDDNLLKNIELFDKLSLRFSNRVLFIKVS